MVNLGNIVNNTRLFSNRTFCFAIRGDADEGDNDDDTGDEISVNFE